MAMNGRFDMSVRVLALLAAEPETMRTSAEIAEALGESAVMVRRIFPLLHEAGFITQRKGPHGGAQLKMAAKEIGLGDVFEATVGEWFVVGDKALGSLMRRTAEDAVKAMNETTLAQVAKRLKKG